MSSIHLSCGYYAATALRFRISLTTLILISEQKIDDIAEGVNGIKALLERLDVSSVTPSTNQGASSNSPLDPAPTRPRHHNAASAPDRGSSSWDQSAHIIDLLRSVVEDENLGVATAGPQVADVVSSLRGIVQALESPSPARSSYAPEDAAVGRHRGGRPAMPHLEAVLDVLRWVRGQFSGLGLYVLEGSC